MLLPWAKTRSGHCFFVTTTTHKFKYVLASSKSTKKTFFQFEIWKQKCADDVQLWSCADWRMFFWLWLMMATLWIYGGNGRNGIADYIFSNILGQCVNGSLKLCCLLLPHGVRSFVTLKKPLTLVVVNFYLWFSQLNISYVAFMHISTIIPGHF